VLDVHELDQVFISYSVLPFLFYLFYCRCRFYKGRHILQERSRQAKRIHLADLRPKPHTAAQLQQQAAGAHASLLMPSSSTPQQQQQQSGAMPYPAAAAGGRKLVIPAPAFISLEAPEGLVKAAAEASGGDTAAAAAAAGAGLGFGDASGFGSSAAVKKIEPEVLVEQVGFSRTAVLG
jgi:hypothetical protein